MCKTIRMMAIIAVALVGFSLILLLATIPFQSMFAREFYGYPVDLIEALPRFPLLSFLFCFLRAACMALLIICCGNKKGSIWLELIIFGCLAIILPAIIKIASPLYSVLLSRMDRQYLVANSVVTNIANLCLIPSNWGQALAYVTCGMSIAFKKMGRKTNHTVINEQTTL